MKSVYRTEIPEKIFTSVSHKMWPNINPSNSLQFPGLCVWNMDCESGEVPSRARRTLRRWRGFFCGPQNLALKDVFTWYEDIDVSF